MPIEENLKNRRWLLERLGNIPTTLPAIRLFRPKPPA